MENLFQQEIYRDTEIYREREKAEIDIGISGDIGCYRERVIEVTEKERQTERQRERGGKERE